MASTLAKAERDAVGLCEVRGRKAPGDEPPCPLMATFSPPFSLKSLKRGPSRLASDRSSLAVRGVHRSQSPHSPAQQTGAGVQLPKLVQINTPTPQRELLESRRVSMSHFAGRLSAGFTRMPLKRHLIESK